MLIFLLICNIQRMHVSTVGIYRPTYDQNDHHAITFAFHTCWFAISSKSALHPHVLSRRHTKPEIAAAVHRCVRRQLSIIQSDCRRLGHHCCKRFGFRYDRFTG